MRYLLDTNIVSEISKRAPNAGVQGWFDAAEDGDLFLSVITLGEIRKGIEQKRRTDPGRARRLESTLATIRSDYRHHIIPVSEEVAEEWGRMCVVYPNHAVDNLLCATAKVHGMTLVTRNTRDIEIHSILSLNPSPDAPAAACATPRPDAPASRREAAQAADDPSGHTGGAETADEAHGRQHVPRDPVQSPAPYLSRGAPIVLLWHVLRLLAIWRCKIAAWLSTLTSYLEAISTFQRIKW